MRQQPLIVGAGPAGTAAAIMLARGGAPPVVLERARETGDALCGGFVSWRTIRTLEQLGIDADALNPSRAVRARIFAGGRCGEAMLPRPALAVSRHRLDTVMQDRAAMLGAKIERGVAVRMIDDRTVTTADGATIAPEALLLASGKHDIRGLARPAEARGQDPALGLRIRIASSPRIRALVADAIELHLFDRGYCGIVLQEDGSANACMAVHRSRLRDAGSPEALLHEIAAEAPALADRLDAGRGADWGTIDAIANVPYGWRTGATTAGVFRLGDQAAVIPSLAGEGIGIAVASGWSSARALLAAGPLQAATWQRQFARTVTAPVRNAGVIWSLAEQRWSAPLLPLLARIPRALGAVAMATRVPAL
ncbi:NAD(P)/FAD-dependent oxidoreductase [Sphingomonas sp. Mn802worker]|uniref:NAD(P)/FAD-dependent oxidoreductase n=1 Tax=Sphingomonas sp. Mn802worker TaxID=629773 RepID=UPI00036C82B4|nr:FAD-dependent monooxygenase [Sphingomonas sp. Mn802worker]